MLMQRNIRRQLILLDHCVHNVSMINQYNTKVSVYIGSVIINDGF